jgi:hypothetical protein
MTQPPECVRFGQPSTKSQLLKDMGPFSNQGASDFNHPFRPDSFTVWALGFKQSSFHLVIRVSTILRLDGFNVHCLSGHAVFPCDLSISGRSGNSGGCLHSTSSRIIRESDYIVKRRTGRRILPPAAGLRLLKANTQTGTRLAGGRLA